VAYNTAWYVHNRVIYTQFSGEVTEEELIDSGSAFDMFIQSDTVPLIHVIDLRGVTRFPINFNKMAQNMSIMTGNEKVACTVCLSNSSLMNFFTLIATKVSRVPMKTFKTFEEVDAFLAHNVSELAHLLPTCTIS
jgi:hypothetical protein